MPIKKTKTTTTKKSPKITKATKAKPKKAVLKKIAPKKAPALKKTAQSAQVVQVEEPKKQELKKSVVAPVSEFVKKYQTHKGDTGSTSVQIALLTERVNELTKHLKKHAKDFDSKRGLLILVGKRRRLLNYLQKTDAKSYETMVTDLKLRK